MFQLIVAVISIALVAALAIASIYYGGDAFQKSSLRANVVTLVNGGQQIAGAAALYKTDFGGASPVDITVLNGQYLTQAPGVSSLVPATKSWTVSGGFASVELVPGSAGVAKAEALRQGGGTQFFVDDTATPPVFKFAL